MKKMTRCLLGLLLALAVLAAGVPAPAAAADSVRVVDLRVLLKYDAGSGNFADGISRQEAAQLIRAVGFLYPDYVQVNVRVCGVQEAANQTLYFNGYSGAVSEAGDALLPGDAGWVTAEPQAFSARTTDQTRLLVIGAFTRQKVKTLIAGFPASARRVSVQMNLTPDGGTMALAGSSVLEAAEQIYETFEPDPALQTLAYRSTADDRFRVEADGSREIRVLVTGGEVTLPEQGVTAETADGLTLITVTEAPAELGFPGGGTRQVLISRCAEPFSLTARLDPASAGAGYAVADKTLTVTAEVAAVSGDTDGPLAFRPDEWTVELLLTEADGTEMPLQMAQDGGRFTAALQLGERPGSFSLKVKADNTKQAGFSRTLDLGMIHLSNQPPRAASEDAVILTATRQKPANGTNALKLQAEEYFTDDGGAENLTYSLSPAEVPGVALADGVITVTPEQLAGDAAEFTVTASDRSGLTAENVFRVNVLTPYAMKTDVSKPGAGGAAYSMGDRPLVTASIDLTQGVDEKTFRFNPGEWTVTAELTDANGTRTQPMAWQDGVFAAELDLSGQKTDLSVRVKAENSRDAGLNLTSAGTVTLTVENDAPALAEDAPAADLTLWFDEPGREDADLTLSLADSFTDDGGKEGLTYRLDPADLPGITLDGGTLTVCAAKLAPDGDGKVVFTVTAEDRGGKTAERTFTLTPIDVMKTLQGGETVLTIDGGGAKDAALTLTGAWKLPEILADYAKANPLTLTGTITFDGVGLEAERSEEAPYTWTAGVTQARETGSHTAVFTASLADGAELGRAEAAAQTDNANPALKDPFGGTPVQLEVPGPWFLFSDIRKDSVTRPVSDFIGAYEALDVITFTLTSSDPDAGLWEKDGAYYFMDGESANMKRAESIVWDTSGEAPKLTLRHSVHGTGRAELRARDQDGAEAENSPVRITLTARYHEEDTLILIAAIALGAVQAIILLLVVRQLLKPKFGAEDWLYADYGGCESAFPVASWKKKGLSLREVLIYSGLPVTGELPAQADKVMLMPGRRSGALVLRGVKLLENGVQIDGAAQDRNRIQAERDTRVNIGLDKGVLTLWIGEKPAAGGESGGREDSPDL